MTNTREKKAYRLHIGAVLLIQPASLTSLILALDEGT